MCNSALKEWDLVTIDAMKAIQLSDKYVKAYFWLVKSMVCLYFHTDMYIYIYILSKFLSILIPISTYSCFYLLYYYYYFNDF